MANKDKGTSFLTRNERHQTHGPENVDNDSKKFGENDDPQGVNMNYQEMSTLGQVVGNEDHDYIPENTENGCKRSGENGNPEHKDVNCQEMNTLGQVAGNIKDEFILENMEIRCRETAVSVEFEDVIINVDVNCEDIGFLTPGSGDQTNESEDSKLENMDIGEKTDASDKNENLNLSEKEDVNIEVAKSGRTSIRKRKMVAHKKSKKYPLRSSLGSNRVLRSRSTTSKTQPEPVSTPVNPVTKTKKRKRIVKQTTNDEFLLMRKRVRYLLARMSYEQILIDSYSSEGWKGQSAEKLRPEKEIERAKSEILRCKCKIREIFQRMDSLSSEGRFDASLFDSEGEIDHEDIFCSKCGSKESSLDNDILLCDGICDRGFHQMCLNPPLLTADIPQGDEGWLCPLCDCKVDCIDIVNDTQGSDITIEDTWEEAYKNASSGSSDDEDWGASNKKKKTNKKESKEQSKPDSQIINKRKKSKAVEGTDASQEPDSSGKKSSASGRGKLSEEVRKKLYESFQENQYPKREVKENLAQELGITYRQVEKWFGNCRHSARHFGEKATPTKTPPSNQDTDTSKKKTTKESKGKAEENEIQKEVIQGSVRNGSKKNRKHKETEPENKDVGMDRDKAIARELKRMNKGKKVR